MNAIQEAKSLYIKHGLSFERDLCHYLEHGVVISRPDRFLMGKAVREADGANADDQWNVKKPDTWYIHCAIGKGFLEWFLMNAPERLPKIAFRRWKQKENKLRFYNTSTFERLIT